MTRGFGSGGRLIAASLGVVSCLVTGSVALAATGENITTTEVQASVVVMEPVGAGFAFDVLNDAVSAVFLNGEIGDSVSLMMSPDQSSPRNARKSVRGVVVMATGVYQIDLLVPINGRMQTVRNRLPGSQATGDSSILFLAQFN